MSLVWNGKADGAIGNGIAFAIVGDHENRPTDMTNVLLITEKKCFTHSEKPLTQKQNGMDKDGRTQR